MDKAFPNPLEALTLLADLPSEGLQFESTMTVPAKLVKAAFSELQPIMSKTAYSKVVGIEYDNGKLRIRASTSLIYDGEIPVIGNAPEGKYKVSCKYQDITEMIPTKNNIEVTITPMFVQFKSDNMESNLLVADEDVQEAPGIYGEPNHVVLEDLKGGLKKLLSLSSISAVFKTGNVLILSNDRMQIRYPTVWVQAMSSGINTLLDTNSAAVLERLLFRAKEVDVYHTDSYVVIKKEFSSLYIPRQSVDDVEPLEDFIKDATLIDTVSIVGLAAETQALLRTVGKVDASITIFQRGIRIDASTSTITAAVNSGTIEEGDTVLDSFTTRLEFFNNLLPIFGESIKLYRKGDWVCIKGPQVLAILSSR